MLNKASGVGKGNLIVGRGKYSVLIQVFAVGTNPFTASTKTMDGWILNPRINWLIVCSCSKAENIVEVNGAPMPTWNEIKKKKHLHTHTHKNK